MLIKQELNLYFKNITITNYKYNNRVYYETDFDLLDVNVNLNNVHNVIDLLIKSCENIFKTIDIGIEFIIADHETESLIEDFESQNVNIDRLGLFVTRNKKDDCIKPYYASNVCNAYINFKYTSFGFIY